METLIIRLEDVEKAVTQKDCVKVQELAFTCHGNKKSAVAPNSWLSIEKNRGVLKLLAGFAELGDQDALAIKVVTSFLDNPSHFHLPNVLGTIVLLDPQTSFPIAIIDGVSVTALRTGGGGGVATKYLARSSSSSVGIIGSGNTALFTFLAVREVLPKIDRVRVYSRSRDRRESFAKKIGELSGLEIVTDDNPQASINDADVIITGTTSKTPILFDKWIRSGVHINAMGFKAEIEPNLLARAKVVGDSVETATIDGKSSVALKAGALTSIYGDLGEIVTRQKPGRLSDEEITVFDSSGLAVQDAVMALHVYNRAREMGLGIKVDFQAGIEKYLV